MVRTSPAQVSAAVLVASLMAMPSRMNSSICAVSAFVPSSIQGGGGAVVGASSFVHRRTCAVAPPAPEYPSFSSSRPSLSTATSATALQMNLFDRFTRVVNANLNNILKNLEDPEKIMNQALEDMQVRGSPLDRLTTLKSIAGSGIANINCFDV
jgi:hypothetical protein